MIAIMSDLIYRLSSLSVSERTIDAGALIFLQGGPVRVLHIVRTGTVHLVRHQRDGATAVLQRATAEKILAEASVYSDTYHCDGLAVSPTTVSLVPVAHVRRLLEADGSFANLWAAYLASELQAVRKRAEIMSLKTVKAKLSAWLAWNDGALPAKGAWKQLADDIGVSPEALYREIAKGLRALPLKDE